MALCGSIPVQQFDVMSATTTITTSSVFIDRSQTNFKEAPHRLLYPIVCDNINFPLLANNL